MRFRLVSEQARRNCLSAIVAAPDDMEVIIQKPKRNLEQNARLWATLTDISKQVDWYGQRLSQEEWKDVLTAGLKRQKVVRGIDGGFVVIGARTSEMTVTEMSELLELATAFAVQQGVRLTA